MVQAVAPSAEQSSATPRSWEWRRLGDCLVINLTPLAGEPCFPEFAAQWVGARVRMVITSLIHLPEGWCVGLAPAGSLVGSRGTCARDFRLQNQQLVAAWQVVFLPDDLTSCPVWLNRWGDLLHKLQMAMVLASGPFVVMVTCAPFGEPVGRPPA